MTTDGDLYGGPVNTSTRQSQLFDTRGPAELGLSCGECGRPMIRTPSGFLSCPVGHGKLIEAGQVGNDSPGDTDDEEPDGRWFEDEPPAKLCCWCDGPATEVIAYADYEHQCCKRHARLYRGNGSAADHPSLTAGERNRGGL